MNGRFGDTTGAPYLEGRLHIPRLRLSTNISFLVDTGAGRTMLSVDDAIRAGVDFGELTGAENVGGIGGTVTMFEEPAVMIFQEPGTLHVYQISILIPPATPDMSRIPSLLGRDILNNWRMTCDPSNKTLTFDILSEDLKIPTSP